MRFKKFLPRTLLVISLVLVISVILTTKSAFASAEEDASADDKFQTGQQNSDSSTRNKSKAENCPCIAKDECPRIYGQSALDITEIGVVPPCPQNGTVRCCGVTISVVQKSDDDAEKSMKFAEGEDESEEVEATTEEFSINFENEAEEMQVDHVQEQSSEIMGNISSTNSNETSSAENTTMINTEADLEPAESVVIKTFDTQSTHNKGPKSPIARRRKIKTSVSSVLTLNGNENSGSNIDDSSERFHNSETQSGNSNPDFDPSTAGNPERVVVSAFAEDAPSSRLATTTIILDSSADAKIPDLLSRTRKLMNGTENSDFSTKNPRIFNKNDDSSHIPNHGGVSPVKTVSPFSRTKFVSSNSQVGSNTRSSVSTTGAVHSATSVSGLRGKFRRPSSLPQATLSAEIGQGSVGGADLITTSDETLHVSPLDQKGKVDSTERPMSLAIKPFTPGGRKKIISVGVPPHTANFGSSSNSTSLASSNFMSTKTKALNSYSGGSGGLSSLSQTSPTPGTAIGMNFPKQNATKSFNNDALTSDTLTPKPNSSSSPSLPVFVPKIRPFLTKKIDGTSSSPSVSISPNKKEQEQDAKTTTTEEILVQKGIKRISLSLQTPSKLNLPFKPPLKSHSSHLVTNNPSRSAMQNSPQEKSSSQGIDQSPQPVVAQIITTPPQNVENGEILGRVTSRPGFRRRKTTTTTPAPVEVSEFEEEIFPRITLSRPLFTQNKASFSGNLERAHSGLSKNNSNAYESIGSSIPVSTTPSEAISPTVETNDITSPAKTTLNRGYRRRVRPLAKVHPDDAATPSLSAPPAAAQIITMPTSSITTPQPRVHAHPSSAPENQNGNDENTNDSTLATSQQKDIDFQKGNKKTNDDISTTSAAHAPRTKHGHYPNKLHQQTYTSTEFPPVLATTDNILIVENNSIDKSQSQDFVAPSVTTDSSIDTFIPTGNNERAKINPPRRKFKVNRNFRTTTTTSAPAVLTRPSMMSKQEDSENNEGKHPVRMTSTYSRIRINKQKEEEGTLHHGNARPSSNNSNNRRFRIPADLQVIRESSISTTTPISVSFSSNDVPSSTTGVENGQIDEEVRSEEYQHPANYDGGSSSEQQPVGSEEGTESYDLVLDKDARKSMQNQTTELNSFSPSPLSPSSAENKSHLLPELVTVLPQEVNHDRHMVVVKRRRRPVTPAPSTLSPLPYEENHPSMNLEQGSEQGHLTEQQPLENVLVKINGEENFDANINLAAEDDNERQVGEKTESVDETDVDIDLKVNIDVTVDGSADDKVELQIEDAQEVENYRDEEEEEEAAGEQEESRVHPSYFKGKFPLAPSSSYSSSPANNVNDPINYNSFVPGLEKTPSKSLTNHAENEASRNSGGIKSSASVSAVNENDPMHSGVSAIRISEKRFSNTQIGNSTMRFPLSITSSSTTNKNIVNKTGQSPVDLGKQVGHSVDSGEINSIGKPTATKTNEMRHSSHSANSPTRFSFSSTGTGTGNNVASSQSASSSAHHLASKAGGQEEEIKQSHHERFNIQALDKNNNIQQSNGNNDNFGSGIRTRTNYRTTGGGSSTKTKTTSQLSPPPLAINAETAAEPEIPSFVFPPYRKSESVLIMTTPEPLSTFTPKRTRYNSGVKSRNITTTYTNSPSTTTTTSTNDASNVENVVEFNSQPTRTSTPTIPSSTPSSFTIVNSSNRHSSRNTNNNKVAYNPQHIAEHEQSRFSVSQFKSPLPPSVNNSVSEPKKRLRKKNKNKVNVSAQKANDVYVEPSNNASPGFETTYMNSPITSYNNNKDLNINHVPTNPTYTTFSITQEKEEMPAPQYLPASTTTENIFSYQIIPTETPYRYTPTTPIPSQVSFSSAPTQKARPMSQPAISIQYQPSHSYNNPSMIDEFSTVKEKNRVTDSKTSSRFTVPEKFDFSGWRVTNSLTTVSPITLTTTETPTTSRPVVRVPYNDIQNVAVNPIRIVSTPQNVATTPEHKYPEQIATSFVWSPAESHSASLGHHNSQRPLQPPQANLQTQEHLHNQPQLHHIQKLPESQNLDVLKQQKQQNVANYQLATKPVEQSAFGNPFNYQVTSNGQSYSIQLADTKPISNGASTKLSPANNNLPGVLTSPSFPPAPTQLSTHSNSYSAHQQPIPSQNPTPQLNLQTLATLPPKIPNQQQQQQSMPVVHTPQTTNNLYQENKFQPPVSDEDKRQNYFEQTGPTSYILPILPQHNPKVSTTSVRIQFGEDLKLQNYNENIRNQTQPAYYQQYSQPAYDSPPSPTFSNNNAPSTAFVYHQEESDGYKQVHPSSYAPVSPVSPVPSWKSQSQPSHAPQTPSYYSEQFSATKSNVNNNNNNNINGMKPTSDNYTPQNPLNQPQIVYNTHSLSSGIQNNVNQNQLPLKQMASPSSLFYSPEQQRQPSVNLVAQPHLESTMNNSPSSYQYNNVMSANQNIPLGGYNNYQNLPQQQQHQPLRVNGAGKFGGSSQQQQTYNKVSFSSQDFNGNAISNKAVASSTLHGLPVAVQNKLPPLHLKEYQQHMQISQHIMNHMNRHSGRTSRANNINGQNNADDGLTDMDLNTSGSENVEHVAVSGDEAYNMNVPVSQEFLSVPWSQKENSTENNPRKDLSITSNSTNSNSTEERRTGVVESNDEKLILAESVVKEVVNNDDRGLLNAGTLPQNNNDITESPNSESARNRVSSDLSYGMETRAVLAPDLQKDTKGVEAEARGVGSNVKEISSAGNLKPNMNFTVEGMNNKTEFTPPKVIQGGFVPILPYSEKDPGPILVKIPQSQDKILSPTEIQINAMNRLNHPNLIQPTNFRSPLQNQFNKLYVNALKTLNKPK